MTKPDFSSFISTITTEKPQAVQPAQAEETKTANTLKKAEPETAPAPYIRIEPRETRTARLQVLMRPSLKAKLKARADKEAVTVNELINLILEQTL